MQKSAEIPWKRRVFSSSVSIGDLHTFAYGSAFPHFSPFQTATAALFLMTALLSPFPELTDGRRVTDSLSLSLPSTKSQFYSVSFCPLSLSHISSPPSTFFVRDLKNGPLVPRQRRMICLSRKSSFVFALLSFGPLSKSAFIFMLDTKAFFFTCKRRKNAENRTLHEILRRFWGAAKGIKRNRKKGPKIKRQTSPFASPFMSWFCAASKTTQYLTKMRRFCGAYKLTKIEQITKSVCYVVGFL